MYIRRLIICLILILMTGCSSHRPSLSEPGGVTTKLNEQLAQWRGTPYRYGGLTNRGIDCSGFVYLTFRDRFSTILPRTTDKQMMTGKHVDRKSLLPGDLLFFKTGHGKSGLHVGIYDGNNQFIHASTSHGVTRSSLQNIYWKHVFWQARRIFAIDE